MKFSDFELKRDNHFVAMQYYAVLLNRTFLVMLVRNLLIGVKVNGLVGIESSGNVVAKELSATMVIKGDLQNPYSYIKSKYIDRVKDMDLLDGSILRLDKSNFIIQRADITNVYYDPKKKWGMGYYPHDGKVYIETNDNRKREFIILGSQSGYTIANLIMAK